MHHRSSHQHESTALENLTHSLVGAALAELALPTGATITQRRIFFIAGVAAANLPDADLLYTNITPPPLGYLLHHRGHTHTLAGIVVQALLVGAVCLLPAVRRRVGAPRTRLLALVAVALLSHLVLDAWNSYGVHPFWPVNSRWYYGDAIFIAEPWLWVFLGAAATMNTGHVRGRTVLGAALVVLVAALAWFGMIPLAAFAALATSAVVLGVISRRWTPRRRASMALALSALFVVAMFGVRERVRGIVLMAMAPTSRAGVIDVILSPEPANPLCWSALTIVTDDAAGDYVTTPGTAAALSSSGCESGRRDLVIWDPPVRQSIARLRELARTDCSVWAWLQFGRAPEVAERAIGGADGAIGDLRYGGARRENFSRMPLRNDSERAQCPPNLTHWGMPRADLLEQRSAGEITPH
jgi:inner membrane protein